MYCYKKVFFFITLLLWLNVFSYFIITIIKHLMLIKIVKNKMYIYKK